MSEYTIFSLQNYPEIIEKLTNIFETNTGEIELYNDIASITGLTIYASYFTENVITKPTSEPYSSYWHYDILNNTSEKLQLYTCRVYLDEGTIDFANKTVYIPPNSILLFPTKQIHRVEYTNVKYPKRIIQYNCCCENITDIPEIWICSPITQNQLLYFILEHIRKIDILTPLHLKYFIPMYGKCWQILVKTVKPNVSQYITVEYRYFIGILFTVYIARLGS